MTCHSTVSIYNNLSSCQSTVSVWSSDHETSGRIDKEFCMLIYHLRRNDLIKYIFFDVFMDLLLCHIRVMLCGKYHCIQTFWSSVFIIFYGYLSLSVRAKIRQRSVLAHFCQLKGKFVCHCDRIRHKFCCFVGCISKHHTLISCSDCFQFIIGHFIFFCFQRLVHSKRNICRLLIDRCQHAACICIKSEFSSRISDLTYSISYDSRNIHVRFCCDFSHDHDHTGCYTSLTCNTAHWILLHQSIQDRV